MIPPGTEDFFAVMCVACLIALWKGLAPERLAATGVFLAWVASAVLHTQDWVHPQYGMLGVDLILLLILVSLMLLTGRRWLVFASAAHVLGIGAHFAVMLDLQIRAFAYFTAMAIWGYAVLLAMVIGTLTEGARERRLRQASGNPASSE